MLREERPRSGHEDASVADYGNLFNQDSQERTRPTAAARDSPLVINERTSGLAMPLQTGRLDVAKSEMGPALLAACRCVQPVFWAPSSALRRLARFDDPVDRLRLAEGGVSFARQS
jgi:hypothetical protein